MRRKSEVSMHSLVIQSNKSVHSTPCLNSVGLMFLLFNPLILIPHPIPHPRDNASWNSFWHKHLVLGPCLDWDGKRIIYTTQASLCERTGHPLHFPKLFCKYHTPAITNKLNKADQGVRELSFYCSQGKVSLQLTAVTKLLILKSKGLFFFLTGIDD